MQNKLAYAPALFMFINLQPTICLAVASCAGKA